MIINIDQLIKIISFLEKLVEMLLFINKIKKKFLKFVSYIKVRLQNKIY